MSVSDTVHVRQRTVAQAPRFPGGVPVARDNMGWWGYLYVEPVYSDRDHEAESDPTASGWGTRLPGSENCVVDTIVRQD